MKQVDDARLKGNSFANDMNIIDAEYEDISLPVPKSKPQGRLVECYQCDSWVPITQTKAREIEVESGRSGGSFTLGGSLWSSNGIRGKRKGSG